jgi:flagellar hook-basal body complex protein FliE
MSSVGPIGTGGGFAGAGGLKDIMALRQQIISQSQLLQQVHTGQAATATSSATSSSTGSFTGALSTALQNVNASQNQADTLSAGYEKGTVTDVSKVMLARQEASVGFEATLQVRNKLLSAYQDIMKLGV